MNETKDNPAAAFDIDISTIDSVVLRRLIEEVRQERELPATIAYNRIYNRHNRSST